MSVKRPFIKSDLKRIDALTDAKINYREIPPLDDGFFSKELADWPPAKKPVTIRLDTDVVQWFKKSGRGYQTRINRLLRRYMETAQEQRPVKAFRTKKAS